MQCVQYHDLVEGAGVFNIIGRLLKCSISESSKTCNVAFESLTAQSSCSVFNITMSANYLKREMEYHVPG